MSKSFVFYGIIIFLILFLSCLVTKVVVIKNVKDFYCGAVDFDKYEKPLKDFIKNYSLRDGESREGGGLPEEIKNCGIYFVYRKGRFVFFSMENRRVFSGYPDEEFFYDLKDGPDVIKEVVNSRQESIVHIQEIMPVKNWYYFSHRKGD